MTSQAANTNQVAFVTSAWERDWPVVLDPERIRDTLESHCHTFPIRLLILNNFTDPKEKIKAQTAAKRLLELGLMTDWINAPDYLTTERLGDFNLKAEEFWRKNPWFSTVHLAALHFLRQRTDWLFYQNGDVWLAQKGKWIERAISALKTNPQLRGLNLCRNIYLKEFYPSHCHRQTEDLWISDCGHLPAQNTSQGFTLSDHAYIIPVAPPVAWKFTLDEQTLKEYYTIWPAYAQPCFEMLYCAAMKLEHFSHGTLKPINGMPITKHKSFPKGNRLKLWFYIIMGFYRKGGRFATAK